LRFMHIKGLSSYITILGIRAYSFINNNSMNFSNFIELYFFFKVPNFIEL